MALSDALFVGVGKDNVTSAETSAVDAADQTKNSAFLTVQSLTNFSAAAAAITTAWKALQFVLPAAQSVVCPFVLAILWLVVSLIASGAATDKSKSGTGAFWASSIFIGFINALTLFAAVVGISSVK